MGIWIGHLGSGLMLAFLALLALRCAGQLGLLKNGRPGCAKAGPAGQQSKAALPFCPAKRCGIFCWAARQEWSLHKTFCPGFLASAAAFFGVLAVQWGFALICWLSLRQPGGLPAFFAPWPASAAPRAWRCCPPFGTSGSGPWAGGWV